jgi:hypothetical protein
MLALLNNTGMEPGKLTQRHILSVRCPMCRAKPKERCTLTTGHPSAKTHLARGLAAAKVPAPPNAGRAALNILMSLTGRGFRALFQHK